ncbi:MAG TPA: helix-turn-helix domain-containing protein [Spirochaetota bacterium]|nr:AraC family transcriptional regulator [Spirochaetota bacterium]HOD13902.1 helix-turn-helix domain-containing protein [Spirochaetota bacterium]HPG49698.1 helix-turn-helix domain-containing protein [Spirochaetota bacterium]HPN12418.1 helix-turn-helix domain-containing protein [Spirochaetota bacterium]HQL80714.1 helix-turn-helix domain-containing protein [Spirochaetota bacterium]
MSIVDLIIIFACGLSLVMALGLVVRPIYFRNMVLAVILALMGYLTFSMYLLHSQKVYEYPILLFFQVPVVLCLGPLLYFYVLSVTGDMERLRKRDILHFIPLLAASMYLIPYFLYSPNAQREIIYEMINKGGYVMLRSVYTASMFIPVIYIAAPLIRIVLQLKKGNAAEHKIVLLLSSLVIWVITGIVGIGFTIVLSLPALKMINLFISLVILCFYLLSQRYPYLVQYGTIHVGGESYSKSYLNGLDLESLGKQLTAMMEQEKIYCDEELSLPRLSDSLGVTPHQLSQFLNQHYNKNYNNFINSYRIGDAQKLLVDEPDRNTLSIALAVGFNSYSAFHSAFRKVTGISPAEYRKRNAK